MFSKLNKGIKFRLTIWFSISLFFSLTFACGTIYFLLSTSLRRTDRLLVEKQAKVFSEAYNKNYNEDEFKELAHKEPNLFISIVRIDGSPLFTHLPEDVEEKDEVNQIVTHSRMKMTEGWEVILLEDGTSDTDFDTKVQSFLLRRKFRQLVFLLEDDIFESYSMRLGDGHWLIVGKSAENREKGLSHIRRITYLVIFPFLFISIVLSFFLAKKLLHPINEIISTIDEIEKGGLESRVKIKGSDDEIDQLAVRFNGLLDSNQKLIANLKGTLDNVAHDLKTPITRLINSAEEAVNQDSSPEKLREALGLAIENGEKIVQLLNAIMDLTEAETGTMNLRLEEIDLQEIIEQTVELYEMVIEDKNMTVHLFGSDECLIRGDRIRIAQAVANLLDNAIKYSPQGSDVRVTLRAQQGIASIAIEDSGKGIPLEELPYIWDRLYRVDHSRSTPGMGIGLSVVRAIAIAHNGNVSVESSLGNGSKFTLELPILRA